VFLAGCANEIREFLENQNGDRETPIWNNDVKEKFNTGGRTVWA
jgi:hypothetical protein|tara:strand:+ start:425 stop:556 length:132 start_codon:yes stop_codon:yes gene_type:complete